jgi:hypothetical protein
MFENEAEYLNPECPWGPLRAAGGLPNVKWCEETLCGWISEPANTWSNLAFVVAGVFLWWVARGERSRTLRFFGPAAVLVGVSSFVYHMSITFVLQVFDFFGMYSYFVMLILLNLVRLGSVGAASFFRALWPTVGALTVLTVVLAKGHLPIQGIVAVLLVVAVVTEVVATRKQRTPYGYFLLALGTIAVAAAFSASDVSRRWCDPHSHLLQGHAIWHVLNSVGIGFSYFHYRHVRALFA